MNAFTWEFRRVNWRASENADSLLYFSRENGRLLCKCPFWDVSVSRSFVRSCFISSSPSRYFCFISSLRSLASSRGKYCCFLAICLSRNWMSCVMVRFSLTDFWLHFVFAFHRFACLATPLYQRWLVFRSSVGLRLAPVARIRLFNYSCLCTNYNLLKDICQVFSRQKQAICEKLRIFVYFLDKYLFVMYT